MSYRTAHKAFTLIEMLISLAIVATIVTIVYGSYAATSRSMEAYGSRMSCSERAHLVLRMMARQIRCAYVPPAAKGAAPVAAFQAEPGGLRAELLSFLTTGGLGTGLDSPAGISRVAYRYDTSSKILSVCCEPGVYNSGAARGSGTWRPVLSRVTSVELGFHDGGQWQPRWDSKHAGRVPQAVKIALTLADDRGREHRYATTVPILCRGGAPQGQQGKTAVGQP